MNKEIKIGLQARLVAINADLLTSKLGEGREKLLAERAEVLKLLNLISVEEFQPQNWSRYRRYR